MFEVYQKGETPQDSTYKRKEGTKKFSYKKAFAHLMGELDMDPEQAENTLTEIWDNTENKIDKELELSELNDPTRKLFQAFRWHADNAGNISRYCKTSTDRETYVHSMNLLDSAKSVTIDVDGKQKSIYSQMHVMYSELVKSKELALFYTVLGNKQRFPSLTEYWEKVDKLWQEDPAFQLKDIPAGITDDPQVPSFFYFNAKALKTGDTPSWDGWVGIIPKPLRGVFYAWLYSIFVPSNKGRQALWLHDGGYTGKSSVIGAIARYLGDDASGAISSGSMKSGFSYQSIYGKRFVSYGDCEAPNLIKHPKIHPLLGNDVVTIDRKGLAPFPARVHAKLFIASNLAPHINIEARNERTRVLYIPLNDPSDKQLKKYCAVDDNGNVKRYDNGDPIVLGGNLEEQLLLEMEAFLKKCEPWYYKLCPKGQDLVVTQDHLDIMRERCVSEEELAFSAICNDVLEFNPDVEMPVETLRRVFAYMTSDRSYRSGSSSDFARFMKYVKDVHGVLVRKTKGLGIIRAHIAYGVTISDDGVAKTEIEVEEIKPVKEKVEAPD